MDVIGQKDMFLLKMFWNKLRNKKRPCPIKNILFERILFPFTGVVMVHYIFILVTNLRLLREIIYNAESGAVTETIAMLRGLREGRPFVAPSKLRGEKGAIFYAIANGKESKDSLEGLRLPDFWNKLRKKKRPCPIKWAWSFFNMVSGWFSFPFLFNTREVLFSTSDNSILFCFE